MMPKIIPSIVTTNLVLNLDASNPSSYSGSGVNWFDISGNSNNGLLINGPTFNSANGGSIVFDGTNDYVNNIGTVSSFPFIQNTALTTLSFWIKFNNTLNLEYITGNTPTSAEKGFFLGKNTNGSLQVSVFNSGGSANGLVNYASPIGLVNDTNWHNYTITINKTINTNTIYKDGVLFSSGAGTGAWTLSSGNSTRTLVLANINNNSFNFFNGNIANYLIYSSVLTAPEILQNFNALKTKFGL
jgi:hypothetical protein